MSVMNGKFFRSLINNEPVFQERSTTFELDQIVIVVYIEKIEEFYKWKKRLKEKVNYKLTDTNIDEERMITSVTLYSGYDQVVEMTIKLE